MNADIHKIGSLCGHCSRDLPLDRRLLFVAELTGYEMVGAVGNAPTRPCGQLFYGQLTIFTWLHTLEVNWKRDVDSNHDRQAYETRRVPNLPAIGWRWKLVDRRGFAPRSPACEAGDLLMIEQPFEMSLNVIAEAGIEPARCRLMRPAPSHLAPPQWRCSSITRWHGVPVLPRSRRVLETPLRRLAPAVSSGDGMEIGAISRSRTGIV